MGLPLAICTSPNSAMISVPEAWQFPITPGRLARSIKAGTVWGNCHNAIDPAVPFGGYKESGLGREHGREGVLAYTETKSVLVAL